MSPIPIGSRHIFMDESGDPSIQTDKEGVSDYFVLSALIVDSSNLAQEDAKARSIVEKFFPAGELKSKRIGANQARRKRILEEISLLDFKHYSHVINKALILTESGLRFRRSFVKYVHRILYAKLFEAFTHLHIMADQYGTSDFMAGFSRYLERRLQRGLFESAEFAFARSADFPFIQVADVIAGSIQRCYSGQDPMSILDPIRSNTIIIEEWPPRVPHPLGIEKLSAIQQHDYLVRRHAVRKVDAFIEEHSPNDDPIVQAQVAAARYLLYHFRSVDPEEFLPTSALQRRLEELGFSLSERVVRSRVIGALRNEGVFIASSGIGIKIPYSTSDLRAFVSTVSSQVVPYLQRLEVCRKHFLLTTEKALDIVDPKEFPELHRYLQGGS